MHQIKMTFIVVAGLLMASLNTTAQTLYYPPILGQQWDTVSPQSLGWCTDYIDTLYDYLNSRNTKAFIVLKDGKIVLEKYFGTFTQDSSWYWASAGKSLEAFLIGQAQEQGLLNIDSSATTYLGAGWTSCTPAQEQAITLKHLLSMNAGLNDTINNSCSTPPCLVYLTPPNTRWSYHNGAYLKLFDVLANVHGQTVNNFVFQNLTTKTGIAGAFVKLGDYNVFFSKARSMARFGLLMQGQGQWNTTSVLGDSAYYNAMIKPSQTINKSYGYLWWLNGQSSFMLPEIQFAFPGPLLPSAPSDVYAGIGMNGQIVNVSPSQGLVVVRMGDAPTQAFVPNFFNDTIWQKLNQVLCEDFAVEEEKTTQNTIQIKYSKNQITATWPNQNFKGELYAIDGRRVASFAQVSNALSIQTTAHASGVYLLYLTNQDGVATRQKITIVP